MPDGFVEPIYNGASANPIAQATRPRFVNGCEALLALLIELLKMEQSCGIKWTDILSETLIGIHLPIHFKALESLSGVKIFIGTYYAK